MRIYSNPAQYPVLYMLAETLSEYEVLFSQWRFHHVNMVERMIGFQSGTGGSSGRGVDDGCLLRGRACPWLAR